MDKICVCFELKGEEFWQEYAIAAPRIGDAVEIPVDESKGADTKKYRVLDVTWTYERGVVFATCTLKPIRESKS